MGVAAKYRRNEYNSYMVVHIGISSGLVCSIGVVADGECTENGYNMFLYKICCRSIFDNRKHIYHIIDINNYKYLTS